MYDARIYRAGNEPLHLLLQNAVGQQGATLLIPDLQRPFRWSPVQVTRLVDSLLRGWPFGTLLLWATDDQAVAYIPSREFWRLVDRVDPEGGTTAGRMDPPVRRGYRMVLDGQQRVQSLILALTGGDAGFKLLDYEWWESVEPDRSTGRSAKYWSKGVLCLDLDNYAEQRRNPQVLPSHVDYTRALQWVVCAAAGGRAEKKPPPTYAHPILHRQEAPGQFIQLSRLWDLAPVADAAAGQLMERIRTELLPEHGVPESRASALVVPLFDLLMALAAVKRTDVNFLELQPIKREGFSADQYDDAVVNIFTRLNAGGSALTEEEITFAWIKKNWVKEGPDSQDATPAFEQLQRDLADEGLPIGMDKLVQAVSVFWAILERQGKLLRPSDLLNGKTVGPLAAAVSQRWSRLAACLVGSAKSLRDLELKYRRQFDSLNAFIVLAAWRFVGLEWLGRSGADVPTRHNVETRLDALFRAHATRFLVLTSWAGRWSTGAGKNFETLVVDLARDQQDSVKESDAEMCKRLENRLVGWVADCVPDAVDYIMRLEAGRREDVRYYYAPLWVWHQLHHDRREASEGINLPTRDEAFVDVDHVVSFKSWDDRLEAGQGQPGWDNDVNQLGNCVLLEKNFNISKQAHPLGDLLAKIDRFATVEARAEWSTEMTLAGEMVESGAHDLTTLRSRILVRTQAMRSELAAFVRDELAIAPEAPLAQVQGEWSTRYLERGKATEAGMVLRQDGRRVTGTYGANGRIDATLAGNRLYGSWSELGSAGKMDWRFDTRGDRFQGTWGNRKSSSDGGEWTGERKTAAP